VIGTIRLRRSGVDTGGRSETRTRACAGGQTGDQLGAAVADRPRRLALLRLTASRATHFRMNCASAFGGGHRYASSKTPPGLHPAGLASLCRCRVVTGLVVVIPWASDDSRPGRNRRPA
jgi:hypothetical protein